MWRKYGISKKDWKKIQRSGGVLIKRDPNTGLLTHINKSTGKTLLVESENPSEPMPGEITPEMAPPEKEYVPTPGYNQFGQWVGEGYVYKKPESENSKNRDAIIKAFEEKYPETNGVQMTLRYNSETDDFDPYVRHKGKEWDYDFFQKNLNHFIPPPAKPKPKKKRSSNPFQALWDDLTGAVTNVADQIKLPTLGDISTTISDVTPDIKITDTSIQDVINTVSDVTPDIKITDTSIQDVANVISDNTPDIKITETSTGDLVDQLPTVPEILDKVDETGAAAAEGVKGAVGAVADAGTEIGTTVTDAIGEVYEGSDLDTLLEDTKDVGDLMLDTVITIATGKPHGLVADAQKDIQNTQTTLQETGDKISETTTTLGEVVTDTVNTSNQVIGEVGTNAAETVIEAADDVVNAFVDAGILTRETKGGEVTEATRGGDVVRDDDLIQLGKKKSDLKAAKKKGKKGLRIDYGVNIPGVGKSGIAA